MGWIGCIHCEKFRCDFVARTFAIIAPHSAHFAPSFMQQPHSPKCTQTLRNKRNMSLGSNGWIWCICCENFRCDFMARTFALIAPLQPVLHQVSCSNETIPNAPKLYEMHPNMGLESNGVDQVHWLWKIPTWLHGTNFCINCTSSLHFAPSFKQ